MRPCLTPLLTAAVLLTSSVLYAQEALSDFQHETEVLARLSYDGFKGEHICFAVSHGGDYRFVRSENTGLEQTVRLQGKMTKEQVQQLATLLGSSEFRSLSGYHGGLIREEAESFGAEISAPDRRREDGNGARRLQWLNADGESPFPGSVSKVVKWLKQFEPKDGSSFEYAEFPDVCPSGGLRLLQPSVAGNLHP